MEDFVVLREKELPDYVHMIPDWLLEDNADEVEFWGMEDWGVPCGAAALAWEDGAAVLKHLYIDEQYRGSGRGGRFFQELVYYVYQQGNMELRLKYIPSQHPELEQLLCAYVHTETKEAVGSVSCTISELAELKYLQGNCGTVKSLSECTEESLRMFYDRIVEQGEDLVDLPLNKMDYQAECSAVVVENGKPAGILLVKEENEGLSVPYMINLSTNIAAPIEMIRFALKKTSSAYPPETKCQFAVINENLVQILEKLGIDFIQKRQCCTVDLSFLEELEREVNSYVEVQIDMRG